MHPDPNNRPRILVTQYRIYHNPRCSKSRQSLALLEQAGIQPEIMLYLDSPPSTAELTRLIAKLGITPRDLLRTGEAEYKELDLADCGLSDEKLITAMCAHPRLIERPIVEYKNRAIIGRPPEKVLSLIDCH